MIVDSHLHVWDLDRATYPWLDTARDPSLAPIDRTCDLDEAWPRLSALGVDAAVLVQAADSDADSDHLMAVAREAGAVAGVVAWVPLDRPDRAAARLDALAAAGPLVGVRALIHDMADPDWIVGAAVRDGLAQVEERGLALDYVTAAPDALAHVPTLVERHPRLRIVVDHLGKPPMEGEPLDRWRGLLSRAAASAQVTAKVSGLYGAAAPDPSHVARVVGAAIEVMGAERLMVGSDWPLCQLAGGLARAWTAQTAALAHLDPHEKDQIMGATAVRTYRLAAPTSTRTGDG